MYTTFHKMGCHKDMQRMSGDTATEIPAIPLMYTSEMCFTYCSPFHQIMSRYAALHSLDYSHLDLHRPSC